MRDMLKTALKTPMFLVLLVILCVYGFSALGKPAEINTYAVVTSIGIDKIDEEDLNYEISLLTFIPIAEQSFTETYKVVSSKGRSVSEAMDFAGLHIGRQVGLSHVKLVVLNKELIDDDISNYLDYLSRSKNMSSSTRIVISDSSAKDFLNAAQELDSESSIKVSELINFNSEYIYASNSSFETFFKGMFGPTKVSLVPFLKLENENDDGISVFAENDAQSGDGNGENTGSGVETSKQKNTIINNGDTIIFKDGKKKAVIDGRQAKAINLIRGDFKTGSIEVKDFSNEDFEHVNLIFEIYNKEIKYKVVFENGVPIFHINMDLTLSLSEIQNPNGMIEKNVEFFAVSQKETDAVAKKVNTSMAEALQIMRDNQVDIINFYTYMHNSNKKQFNKFLKSLDDKDNYLSNMVFKSSVKVYSK